MTTIWVDSITADREADILTPSVADHLRCVRFYEGEWGLDREEVEELRSKQMETLTDAIKRARRAEDLAHRLASRVRELEDTKRFLEDSLVAVGKYQ